MLGARKQVVLGGDVFRDEYSLAFDGTNDYIDCGASDNIIQVQMLHMLVGLKHLILIMLI